VLFYLSSEIVSLFISNLFFGQLSILPHQSSIFYTPFFYSYSTLFYFQPIFMLSLLLFLHILLFKKYFFAFYVSSEIVLFISLYSPGLFLSISTFTSLFLNCLHFSILL